MLKLFSVSYSSVEARRQPQMSLRKWLLRQGLTLVWSLPVWLAQPASQQVPGILLSTSPVWGS